MKKATHRKQALMIAIFLLAFTLSLFSFGTTPRPPATWRA